LILYAASGEKLLEIDGPKENIGMERLYFLAKQAGDYRLEIRASEDSSPGRYEARVTALRAATEADKIIFAAEQSYNEGSQLISQPDAFQKGILKFQAALEQARAGHDQNFEADIIYSIARVYSLVSDRQHALSYFQQALPLWQTLGDQLMMAATLNNIAAIY